MTTSVRRKLIVASLAASLGLGGVLFSGAAAFADEPAVVPAATASPAPTTAPDPASVESPVATDGPAPAPAPAPTGDPALTAAPAPVPTAIDLLTPEAGKPAIARTVVFAGTAPQNAVITVTGADKTVLGTATVTELNVFIITYTYGPDASAGQAVTVTGALDGKPLNTVRRAFTIPEQNLPAPVITSPTAGSTVYGDAVTFTGTGTPGKNVVILALPTAALEAAANARSAQAAPEPMDPADPIVVGEDGTWTATLTAEPNDYTATAVLADIDSSGKLVSLLSPPSAPVQFVLAATPIAPVVIVTPTPTPTPTAPTPTHAATATAASTHQLANTGVDARGILAAAGALSLAGAALVAARRKRA